MICLELSRWHGSLEGWHAAQKWSWALNWGSSCTTREQSYVVLRVLSSNLEAKELSFKLCHLPVRCLLTVALLSSLAWASSACVGVTKWYFWDFLWVGFRPKFYHTDSGWVSAGLLLKRESSSCGAFVLWNSSEVLWFVCETEASARPLIYISLTLPHLKWLSILGYENDNMIP